MPSIGFKRVILPLGVVLAVAMLSTTALPKPEEAPRAESMAGQLLIASPDIGDPRFYHAVILMVRHNKNGALGIIINRPVEERSLASLLKAVGQDDTGVEGNVRVFAGGPVEPALGFVVHSAEYRRGSTIDIDGRVAITSSPEILRDLGRHRGPEKSLVAFGYAGWGPGQLEHEMELHGWFTAPEDPKLVFDWDRAKVWDEAMARRTLPI